MAKDIKKQIEKMRKQPGKMKDNFGTYQPEFKEKKDK